MLKNKNKRAKNFLSSLGQGKTIYQIEAEEPKESPEDRPVKMTYKELNIVLRSAINQSKKEVFESIEEFIQNLKDKELKE